MIVEMAKIRILGPRTLLSAVLGLLQKTGDLHIESEPRDLSGAQSEIPVIRRHVLDPESQRMRETLESALEKTRRLLLLLPPAREWGGREGGGRVGGVPDDRTGPAPVPPAGDEAALRDRVERLDPLLARAESLLGERKVLEDELSLFSRYDKVLKVLEPLITIVRESRELACTGLILQARDRGVAPLLEQALSRLTGDRFEIYYREVDRETLAGLLVFPAGMARETRALLWERNIGELRLPSAVADKPIGEALEIIRRKQEEIPRRIRDLDAALADLSARSRGMLEETRLLLSNRIERLLASGSFFETRLMFLLYGWIPAGKLAALETALAALSGETIVVERLPIEASEEERVPVVISNSRLVRPFEIFTRVLPLPRYRTTDPTPLVALFFPLFYGIIIGDVGYGILLLAAALLAKRRYGAIPFVADTATIFSWAAAWTVLWGIAYGELFGDLGSRIGMKPLLLHRMADFREALLLALGLGAAHILLGIALGIRTSLRCGQRREAFSRAAGLGMVIALLAAAAGVLGMVPRAAIPAGLAAAAAGLAAAVLSGGAASVMKLHNLVNILSYLRITGVGVASVALAGAANMFPALVPWPALGILAAAILHAINLAFCILSPTIQTLRLHYVEFFENFFSSGGRPYRPFKTIA